MAKLVLEVPEELIRDMKEVEGFLGFSHNEVVVSAIRRFVDDRKKLIAQAINK